MGTIDCPVEEYGGEGVKESFRYDESLLKGGRSDGGMRRRVGRIRKRWEEC